MTSQVAIRSPSKRDLRSVTADAFPADNAINGAEQRKKVVLSFVDYFLPGYKAGGPIRAVANLARSLADEFEFRIVTRDRDFRDEVPYGDITAGKWYPGDGWKALYTSPKQRALRAIRALVQGVAPDLLYFNSLCSPQFTMKPLLLRRLGLIAPVPMIVAPRGECFPPALRQKQYKKAPYLFAAKLSGLFEGALWHASSEEEAAAVRAIFGDEIRIGVAADLSAPFELLQAAPVRHKAANELKVVFAGRIARIKNLDFALRCLQRAKARIVFHIYGALDDPDYWSECQTIISELSPNVQVEYKGAVPHAQMLLTYGVYDLLFLPSKSENFGYAIGESMQAGCPALTSDRTIWRHLERAQAGWDLPLDGPAAFRAVLEKCAAMPDIEYQRLRSGARELAYRIVAAGDAEREVRRLFRSVVGSQ